MGEEEDQMPKGDDVIVDLEVTLRDLYVGHHFKVRGEPREYEVKDTSSRASAASVTLIRLPACPWVQRERATGKVEAQPVEPVSGQKNNASAAAQS
jgi:hypothetical protein